MEIWSLIIAILALLFSAFTYLKHDKKLKDQARKINEYQLKKIEKDDLESKKAAILAPKPKTKRKPRKTKKQMIQNIMRQAQKAGMKPQEIAERLGLPIEE